MPLAFTVYHEKKCCGIAQCFFLSFNLFQLLNFFFYFDSFTLSWSEIKIYYLFLLTWYGILETLEKLYDIELMIDLTK